MTRDLLIIPKTDGNVEFSVTGAEEDSGLLLLQRLYVLLFSSSSDAYRGSIDGSALFDLLDGGNLPPAGVLNARLSIATGTALASLDAADRALVSRFSGEADDDGNMILTLDLVDGTTLYGRLTNG